MKVLLVLIISQLMALPSYAGLTRDGAYSVDLAHTNVGFAVSHMGVSLVIGRFNKFSGDIKFESGGESIVNFEVETSSVDTNQSRRDRHLRSGDFFNVSEFPTMKFASTSVDYTEEGDPAVIHGNLTLLRETKPVSLKVETLGAATGPQGKYRVGYVAKATIKRTDFGMDKLLLAAGDEVDIQINIELIQE